MIHQAKPHWSTRTHQVFDAGISSARQRARQIIDFTRPGPDGQPARLQRLAERGAVMIKAHPYAALGIAFALGYVVTRMARR